MPPRLRVNTAAGPNPSELRRSPTRTPGTPVRGARSHYASQQGGGRDLYTGKRWAVPRVGRSEGGSTYAYSTSQPFPGCSLPQAKGGPGEESNLGWPGGGLGDLDDSIKETTLVAPRTTCF